MGSRDYVLISPCRNEAAYMQYTLESVIAQSVPPAKWVIVDDGSTDGTRQLLERYTAQHSYIQVVRREDRGKRKVGPGVIEAFYDGYRHIDPSQFAYLCKLDMDLDLPPKYFETLIERMESNPRLGTCSGKPYYMNQDTRQLVSEGCGDEMSVGMTKFYRMQCFQEMGGFVREVMWDGIDCHRCRMLGWIACSWNDPPLRFTHLRPMGSSQQGILTGRKRHGYGQYFMGTSLPYMAASMLYRIKHPPAVLGAAAIGWGYLSSLLARQPRYDDPEFRRFLRNYQWRCLLRGKHMATHETNAMMAPRWKHHKQRSASHQTHAD